VLQWGTNKGSERGQYVNVTIIVSTVQPKKTLSHKNHVEQKLLYNYKFHIYAFKSYKKWVYSLPQCLFEEIGQVESQMLQLVGYKTRILHSCQR